MTVKEYGDQEETEETDVIPLEEMKRSQEDKGEDDYLVTPKKKRITFSKLSFFRKFLFIIQNITVEPVVFLMGILISMPTVVLTSFVEYKFCLISLSYPEEVCRNLSHNKSLEDAVQTMTANFNMNKVLIETVPAVIVTFFIGAYSDRFGRKKMLMLPALGGLLSMSITTFAAVFMKLVPAQVLYVGSVFQSVTGGWTCILITAGSYLADVCTPRSRTVRQSIMQGAFLTAAPIATSFAGVIFEYFGYLSVFGMCLGVYCLVLFYIWVRIQETVEVDPEDDQKNFVLAFLSFQNLIDCFRTLTKKRENNHRSSLILLYLVAFFDMLVNLGESTIYYLFFRWKFEWSELMFSRFSTTNMAAVAVGPSVLPILKLLGCEPSTGKFGIVSIWAMIIKGIVFALSPIWWMYFAGCSLVVLTDIINPVCRSIMSQYVSHREQGKVLALMGAFEASTPAFASVIYTQVYNSTRTVFSGTPFFLTSGLSCITLTLFGIVVNNDRIHKQESQEENVDVEEEEKGEEKEQKEEDDYDGGDVPPKVV